MKEWSELVQALNKGISTHTVEESHALAAKLVKNIPLNLTLALSGEVGAGKTTFTQGLAKALEVKSLVTSPTFAIFNIHEGKGRRLVHLDAYRLKGPEALDALLLDEFLTPPCLLVCEWPEIVLPALPHPILWLELKRMENGTHHVKLIPTPPSN